MAGSPKKLFGYSRLVLHDQRHDKGEDVEGVKQLQLDRPLTSLLVQVLGDQIVDFRHKQFGSGDQIEADADGAIEALVAANQIEGDHAQVVVQLRMRLAGVLTMGAQLVENCIKK